MHLGSHNREFVFQLPKHPLLSITPSRTPSCLSFASRKRSLAFYSATENALFAINSLYGCFLKKMCRIGVISASDSGKWVPGGAIRALRRPGLDFGEDVFHAPLPRS